MTLEEKINDCVQDLCIAYESGDITFAEYINQHLKKLIAKRSKKQIKQMEIEKGLV